MTLLQLRIFSMATRMSFQKVAEELYLSPSSVTKYISSLESELNQPLFIRHRNKVYVSEFGRDFLPYANDILQKEEAAIRFAGGRTEQEKIIQVGLDLLLCASRWDSFYLPLIRAKNSFVAEHPGWNVAYRFLDFGELRVNLNQHKTDFSVLEVNNAELPSSLLPELDSVELYRNEYLLAVPGAFSARFGLDEGLTENAERVESLMFVNEPASKKVCVDFTGKYHISPRLVPLGHWGEVLMKLASGDGAALLPLSYQTAVEETGGVVCLLNDERLTTGLYAIWHCGETDAVRQDLLARMERELRGGEAAEA